MLYREVIAVCSEIYIKHINTLCGLDVEFLCVQPGSTYMNKSQTDYLEIEPRPLR